MKIGIEAQRIFRPKKHGMDMVALETVREFQKMDSDHEFIVFVKPDEDVCLEESKNLKIVYLNGPYPIWEQVKLPKAAEEHGVDLLHCTSNTAPIRCNVPLVITLHDIIYLEKNNLFASGFTPYQKFGNVYRKWVVPSVAQSARQIITVSNFEKRRIAEFMKIDESKLSAVYNGINDKFRVIDDQELLENVVKKYNLPKRYNFFFGNTDPKKNTPRVLEAYIHYLQQSDEKVPLVIADFDESLVDQALQKNNASNLKSHFVLPGYIANADIPAILNRTETMLYPSMRESFGIPIIEAMACGTPVITSNTSSMPEVSGGAAHIVDPSKTKEITNALLHLESHADHATKLRDLGLKRAAEFSWKNTALGTLDVYNHAINE